MDTIRPQNFRKNKWTDILIWRRASSDLLWLTFHSWSAAQYKYSKDRNFTGIRNDVFKHPIIEVCLDFIVILTNLNCFRTCYWNQGKTGRGLRQSLMRCVTLGHFPPFDLLDFS